MVAGSLDFIGLSGVPFQGGSNGVRNSRQGHQYSSPIRHQNQAVLRCFREGVKAEKQGKQRVLRLRIQISHVGIRRFAEMRASGKLCSGTTRPTGAGLATAGACQRQSAPEHDAM
jgi:hypothetical protein